MRDREIRVLHPHSPAGRNFNWADVGLPHPDSPAGRNFDYSKYLGVQHPNSPAARRVFEDSGFSSLSYRPGIDDGRLQPVWFTSTHLQVVNDVLRRDLTANERATIADATEYIDAKRIREYGLNIGEGLYQDAEASFVHAMTGIAPNPDDPRWNTSVTALAGLRMTARNAGQRALAIYGGTNRGAGDGRRPFNRADARILANAWIQANFEFAQQALGNGNRDLALRYFAYALHTLQDSTSPSHHDFQPWGIPGAQGGMVHVRGENFSPGPGSNLHRATRELYQWFFVGRSLPGGDLFGRYGADFRNAT
jgi:hypothetical protein